MKRAYIWRHSPGDDWVKRWHLAATFTVALVAATLAWRVYSRQQSKPAASPQLASLVTAVGSRRAIEPRLTGGFSYGPLMSPTRSAAGVNEQPPDVRIAIAEIEKLETRERSPTALALLGVAYLSVGDAHRAVPVLEEAVSVPHGDARVRSDLAAAYLVRALDPDNAQDLPRALTAADLAAKADPTLVEARFNRALALERLHLTVEGRQAWQDYLQTDGTSAWASEARSHAITMGDEVASSADDEMSQIDRLADTDPGQPIPEPLVQPARDWLENQLLTRWPDAVGRSSTSEARAIVARARRVASAVAMAAGDAYFGAAIDAIEKTDGSPAMVSRLASAHIAFRRATTQYENNEFVESGRGFATIRGPLERARSPLAYAARLQIAISAYFAGDIDGCTRELDAIIPELDKGRYVRLLGQTYRMRALVESVRARFGRALEYNMRALQLFQAGLDAENLAAIESSVAEILEFLGEPREAWAHRARGLAGLRAVRNPRRRHTMLISSVLACLRQGSPEAAAYFQTAVLDNAKRWNRPEALAEAYVRQAELHGQIGDITRVSTDLAEARRWTGMAPPGALSRQIEARIQLASASFTNQGPAVLDESALTAALSYLRKAGLNWALAKAYLARGRAYAARGRPDLAEQDFLAGIEEFEAQRAALTAESLRASYFDQPWDLFREMISLQTTTRRRPDVALNFAERGRARTLLEAVARSDRAVPFDVRALQSRLPSGVTIVYYSVLEYSLVVWRLTPTRLESYERSVTSAELSRLVNRFRTDLDDRSLAFDAAGQLYDLLVRDALKDVPPDSTLVFIPDGVLHGVPFAALVDRGTGRYLVQDKPIAVAPSASVFIEASAPRHDPPARDRTALVVGSPDTRGSGESPLADLPDARREVEEISRLYSSVDTLTASDATKQRFLDAFDKHDIVHFAGHAISNSDFPALSRLVFAGSEDGISDSLFAHELASRHFTRARLLVLAACQTSGGRIRAGEGVLSLARPFLAAGVPTVVASLWDADDRATRTLLVAFHERLRAGATPPQALRAAQLAALASADRDVRGVSKWAGFIVIGSVGASVAVDDSFAEGRGRVR